jgi:hypothetical protein
MGAMISASSLWRVERCPASATLPRVGQLHGDAEAGTEAHTEHELNCPPDEMAEAAFAYNPETGKARFLGQGLKRKYDVDPQTEIPGTVDRAKRAPVDGVAEVRDYKSGFGYMVAPPASNLQLAHNALCVADVQGADSVRIAIDRPDASTSIVLDALDLAAARERIRALWRAAHQPDPRVVTGDHCWRCECITRCPAHLTMAIAFTEGAWPGVMPTDGLTPERVAQGWEFLKNAKRVLGLVEKTYRAIASQTPIDLGNGKVLGQRTVEREALDGPITFQTLRDMHGEAVARAAVSMETSKTALEEALKPVAGKGKRAGMVRDALTEIGARNGVVVSRQVRVEEFSKEE